MTTESPIDANGYFRWQASVGTPPVALAFGVMHDLERRILTAFRPRGPETGGILLGHRNPESGELVIEGFTGDAVAEGSTHRCIGIYRSQMRPGLAVTPEDCVLVEKLLPRSEGVLLLIKPLSDRECVAAFFLCDGGAVVDEAAGQREFPFGGSPITPPQTNVRRNWLKVLLPVTAAAAGVALAVLAHGQRDARPAENPVALAGNYERTAPREEAPPINSSSATPLTLPPPKPAPPAVASSATGEQERGAAINNRATGVPVRPRSRRTQSRASLAMRNRQPGRVKKMFGGITSKASHLWPFHSAKPD